MKQYIIRYKTFSGSEKQVECWALDEKGARFQDYGRHDVKEILWAVLKYVKH